MSVGYDVGLTALSVVIAVAIAGLGFAVALQPGYVATGGAIVGMAVVAMHYTGMAALQIPARASWDSAYVIASVLIAATFASTALWRAEHRRDFVGRAQAVTLLVLGIVGLHFTAMAAVIYTPDPTIALPAQTMAPQWLAVAIAAVTFLILCLGMTGSVVDEHLAQRNSQEAERLRQYVAALESTKLDLENTTEQLRNALREASAASLAKSQFLAAMSHELRTPLNAIIGFSEILQNQLFGPIHEKRYRTYHTEIANSGKHLLGLINDILDFSKMDSGSFGIEEKPVDLRRVALDSLHIIQAQAEKGKVRTSAAFDNDLPLFLGDEKRLRQILLNLLSNAVKFTPEQGEVALSIAKDADGIRLYVSDTGIGMAEDKIPKAFELFGQIDHALSRKYEGTGLGLPLARRLAELHGGTLTLESKLGRGTTAIVFLPAARFSRDREAA
jgi:signal transduction histidine kinase